MDMLSNIKPPTPKSWPDAPAERGKTYGVNDPIFKGQMLCVMSMETWLDFGTLHEAQRRKLEQQDQTLIQLKATNEVLVAQLADLQGKHHNLKEATRKERTDKALKRNTKA